MPGTDEGGPAPSWDPGRAGPASRCSGVAASAALSGGVSLMSGEYPAARVAHHPPAREGGVMDLEGRVAVVTGGSRGIGRQVATGLAESGATVVLLARDAARVEQVVAEPVARGQDVTGAAVDVADTAAVRALPARLGPLAAADVLVNAAGVMSEKTARTLRTSDDEWRRVMGVNLDGVLATTAAFVPGMVERRWGRVVNLSACLGRMGGPGTAGGLAPYRVSKVALNALTRNLSAELGDGRRGVLVDAVCPGHCRTDMGGEPAPRSAAEGAETVLWLVGRDTGETGRLREDRAVVPW
ncbi:MAG: classical family protein [Frankiales bacterium]|nr:classical family protein [Frankiales bacterium]